MKNIAKYYETSQESYYSSNFQKIVKKKKSWK